MIHDQAIRLLERTKEVRFFRGQLYDTHADEYLRELLDFLGNVSEMEVKMERLRGMLLRASIYISAEQRVSNRMQGPDILRDIEAMLK